MAVDIGCGSGAGRYEVLVRIGDAGLRAAGSGGKCGTLSNSFRENEHAGSDSVVEGLALN
jgi:hypothetical protein